MKKIAIILATILILVSTIIYIQNYKQIEKQEEIEYNYQEKIPLYYNIDNQNIIYEMDSQGNFKEVIINGNS